jgi:phosphoribosyl-AMP cyclohydrolase / phosphoribosyl-ATP pyrophosphohydrolase
LVWDWGPPAPAGPAGPDQTDKHTRHGDDCRSEAVFPGEIDNRRPAVPTLSVWPCPVILGGSRGESQNVRPRLIGRLSGQIRRRTHRLRWVDTLEVRFDDRGLVPCIVQDWTTGEVLTLAYMNAEALQLTEQTREMHFWSRSRQELWHKGATSGNTQVLKALRYDCDADALLALVEPTGPACHTGERTCFYRGTTEPQAPYEVLPYLERTITARKAAPTNGSYTAELLANPSFIGEKVEEEAEEVARAAREETDERVANEAADVIYHLSVLLASRDLRLADAQRVLDERRR